MHFDQRSTGGSEDDKQRKPTNSEDDDDDCQREGDANFPSEMSIIRRSNSYLFCEFSLSD